MAAISVILLGCVALSGVSCQLCSDLDTDACHRLISVQSDFCTTSPLAGSACKRTCNNCPLTCYHCPSTPVRDANNCTTTKTCPTDETCIIKTLHASDGHMEHLLTCESKLLCEGFGFGFNAMIGKREVEARASGIDIHCCHSDLCNAPDFKTTTQAPTQHPQTVPTTFNCHNDIVFVVDESASIGSAGFNKIIQFITDIVKRLDIGVHETQVGLLVYDNQPHVEWYLKDYTTKADLLSALTYVPYHDGISRADLALQAVDARMFQYTAGDRLTANNVAVVITDGRSANHAATVKAADQLKADGVTILAVGVGNADDAELRNLATDSNKDALKVIGYDHLPNAIPLLLPRMCR